MMPLQTRWHFFGEYHLYRRYYIIPSKENWCPHASNVQAPVFVEIQIQLLLCYVCHESQHRPVQQLRPNCDVFIGRIFVRVVADAVFRSHEYHSHAACVCHMACVMEGAAHQDGRRSEEHTSELQSRGQLVCRLPLEQKRVNLGTM